MPIRDLVAPSPPPSSSVRPGRPATDADQAKLPRGRRTPARSARISDSEQLRLWARARAGDVLARERLALSFDGLMRSLARQVSRGERDGAGRVEDLQQDAHAHLLDALERFDPGRGVPLAAFVASHVRRRLIDDLAAQRPLGGVCVRVPRETWLAMREVRASEAAIAAAGLKVTDAAIAERCELPVDRVATLRAMAQTRRVEMDEVAHARVDLVLPAAAAPAAAAP